MLPILLAAAAAAATPRSAPQSTAETAWRACVDRTTTNTDWGVCGSRYVSQADAALNAKWKQLMAATSGKTRTDLIAEERAWIAYRQSACAFYANGDWGREGTVLDAPACTAGVIEQRTKALSAYLAFMKPI